jgi:lipopolysaccharide biosynthesis protein
MAVRKIKSQYGDAYYVSIDLVTKGGKLIEHLVRLHVHRFDANSRWKANIEAIAEDVDLFATTMRMDEAEAHLRAQKKRADKMFGEGWDKQT